MFGVQRVKHISSYLALLVLSACSQSLCSDERRVKDAVVHEMISWFSAGVQRYAQDCGTPPTTDQGLPALVTDPGIPGWRGPYLDPPVVRLDPWGTAFRYRLIGTNFVIHSAGPDKKFDTRDDIWEDAEPYGAANAAYAASLT